MLQIEAGKVEVLLDLATGLEPPEKFSEWLGLSLDLYQSMRSYTLDLESDEITGCRAARQDLREVRRDWEQELDEVLEEGAQNPDDPDVQAEYDRLSEALDYNPGPIINRMCRRVGRFVYKNGTFVRR